MGYRVFHFALTDHQLKQLIGAWTWKSRRKIIEDIEQQWDRDFLAESDKAWDAMHRCLSDGTLNHNGGKDPLRKVVLGGKNLDVGADYIASLVLPSEVSQVAAALQNVTEDWLRERYAALDPSDYDGPWNEEDFEYTWSNFQGVRKLFQRAAESGRGVLFTVDQ